jgi:predicted O-linked N-acetylglucosamine transferase (SPINDLY family)
MTGSQRKLHIGYVSPDFREHCQSLFTAPLLSHHDRREFKIHCYAHLPAPDATSRRLAGFADVWRPIQSTSDAEVESMIRADGIDILVDLTMHMSNGRPLLFARKPAPVQVAWLAYPGTTGQKAIDVRLTDPWLDPPDFDDHRYVERSIRLPSTFWCYDPGAETPAVNTLPALAAGYVTFGCLNNFCKVSDLSLHLWGRILGAVPDSRLILLAAPGTHRSRVLDILQGFGITANRIEFVPYQARHAYLATYQRIDLCLDTLPYNGHTTSLDAYWMGVPVITRVGRTVVGRAGWSQLNNLNLPELAAFDDAQFVQKAVELAGDLETLSKLRAGLRERMLASPLMDGAAFAAAIESVYRRVLGLA